MRTSCLLQLLVGLGVHWGTTVYAAEHRQPVRTHGPIQEYIRRVPEGAVVRTGCLLVWVYTGVASTAKDIGSTEVVPATWR